MHLFYRSTIPTSHSFVRSFVRFFGQLVVQGFAFICVRLRCAVCFVSPSHHPTRHLTQMATVAMVPALGARLSPAVLKIMAPSAPSALSMHGARMVARVSNTYHISVAMFDIWHANQHARSKAHEPSHPFSTVGIPADPTPTPEALCHLPSTPPIHTPNYLLAHTALQKHHKQSASPTYARAVLHLHAHAHAERTKTQNRPTDRATVHNHVVQKGYAHVAFIWVVAYMM
jgi:hypothetical protein